MSNSSSASAVKALGNYGQRNVAVSTTQRLVESAVLLAMGVVLSVLKLFELPYGGSVTIASMFPVLLISYRHGLGYGLVSATVFGGIQQLFGLKNLSYVSSWQSVLAVIFLDYVIAFAVIGFGGVFRRRLGDQAKELIFGSLLVSVLRYICHVISGATVWAGLSIPTKAALAYSLAYNATYMVPEAIVLVVVSYFLGNAINFSLPTPKRIEFKKGNRVPLYTICAIFIAAITIIADVVLVFSNLQDGETGEWYPAGFKDVNWVVFAIVTGIGIIITLALLFIDRNEDKKAASVSEAPSTAGIPDNTAAPYDQGARSADTVKDDESFKDE